MALIPRAYGDGSRTTISKPGVSAMWPPAVDYKYLSLDSRLNQGRPLEVGLIPNNSFGGGKIFYGTTYPKPPAVDIFAYRIAGGTVGIQRQVVCRDADSKIAYQRTSWVIAPYVDGFQIGEAWVYRHSQVIGSILQLYYIAWQVQ